MFNVHHKCLDNYSFFYNVKNPRLTKNPPFGDELIKSAEFKLINELRLLYLRVYKVLQISKQISLIKEVVFSSSQHEILISCFACYNRLCDG